MWVGGATQLPPQQGLFPVFGGTVLCLFHPTQLFAVFDPRKRKILMGRRPFVLPGQGNALVGGDDDKPLPAQRANRSLAADGRTVGPLDRPCEQNRVSTRSPGRCPGLGEPEPVPGNFTAIFSMSEPPAEIPGCGYPIDRQLGIQAQKRGHSPGDAFRTLLARKASNKTAHP